MLINVSYRSKEKEQLIKEQIGTSFSFIDRLKMRGIGSQKFILTSGNKELEDLLNSQSSLNHCNIELRKKGIAIWFRVKVHSWIVIMPYRSLTIYKSKEVLTLFSNNWRIKLRPALSKKIDRPFVQKLLDQKAKNTQSSYYSFP